MVQNAGVPELKFPKEKTIFAEILLLIINIFSIHIMQFILDIFAEFKENYDKNNKKEFLLFDLANAKENDHTRVLKHLFSYKDDLNCHIFLNMFLKRYNLPLPLINSEFKITDQEKAIGLKDKSKGFIDLFIEYKDINDNPIKIIIENKVCNASDTDKQLARYIATISGIQETDFDKWYDSWDPNGVSQNTTMAINTRISNDLYVIYLTKDGSKEPDKKSLPDSLREEIGEHYYPLNYIENILPWLKEDVLPHCPYQDNGIMIAGIQQYIAYLNYYNQSIDISTFDSFKKEFENKSEFQKYDELIKAIGSGKDSSDDNVTISFRNSIEQYCRSIFKIDKPEGWILDVAPNYMYLYKKSWLEFDKKKYAIPSVHFCANKSSSFSDNDWSKVQWTLTVTHLTSSNEAPTNRLAEEIKKGLNLTSDPPKTNHDRNMNFVTVATNNVSAENFQNYMKEVIEQSLIEYIKIVDAAIQEYEQNK